MIQENTESYVEWGEWLTRDEIRLYYQQAMEEILHKIKPCMMIPHHLMEFRVHDFEWIYGHEMGMRLKKKVPEGVRVQMLQWGEFIELE